MTALPPPVLPPLLRDLLDADAGRLPAELREQILCALACEPAELYLWIAGDGAPVNADLRIRDSAPEPATTS